MKAIYAVKWSETHTHEVDIEADGPDEALEAFWLQYNNPDPGSTLWSDSTTEIDGPNDINVRWFAAVKLR